jgi:hypothetical protein
MPEFDKFAPVTLGHIRFQGRRNLLPECSACHRCATVVAGQLPDHTRITRLGDRMVCTRCGHVGAKFARREKYMKLA